MVSETSNLMKGLEFEFTFNMVYAYIVSTNVFRSREG
jgi:hypothetical protein